MADSSIVIPDGYTLHTERTTHILLPSAEEAFLNPIQEFNRDLSVACIRTWSEDMNKLKETRWRALQKKKAAKENNPKRQKTERDIPLQDVEFRPYKVTILEALSATGLRSIRYAKEIPLIKQVIANDLSSSACEAMRRNAEINGLLLPTQDPTTPSTSKILINEGDACDLMYSHRHEKKRVDVVDLDPYGTAGPFIDAAVQSVTDDGLLCVTCTDLAVLATTNYPEKCFANYGGIPVKAEYCHEAALRLVLHTIATSAARYGRYIEPLLSLSIDFYVRLFIRVKTGPAHVKKLSNLTSTYYVCSGCQSFHSQPLAKRVEQPIAKSDNTNLLFKIQSGPPVSSSCDQCGSTYHVAGPMWNGPLHDRAFVNNVLAHVDEKPEQYGTSARMKGMLTLATEELDDAFYFTPQRVASFFHCECPSLLDVSSALLNAGYAVSRSHASPGSLKTSASREVVHDVFRAFVQTHPVKPENIKDGAPARKLLNIEPKIKVDFTLHPQASSRSDKFKLVRYQQNPTANWGPKQKAQAGKKRQRQEDAD